MSVKLIRNPIFEPDTLKILGNIFDEVWATVAPDFNDDVGHIETTRTRLAVIILDLAADGQLGAFQIAMTAGRLMRQELAASR
jgi:hypothetical protein